MNLISLFSGQGGFELAAQWMGWDITSCCEIDSFCQRILKYYWPNAYHHDDVKTIDYEEIKRRINPSKSTIIVGGFPCQPFSSAGKREGKKDNRYLWPYCIEAVRAIRPGWCLFENVRGLVNWNGGLVFDEVQADLESAGYEVTPFILPAAGVNAPHRRDRVWFVANAIGQRFGKQEVFSQQSRRTETARASESGLPGNRQELGIATYANSSSAKHSIQTGRHLFEGGNWDGFPTQPPLCFGDDGLPAMLHRKTIQNENSMDRDIIIKSCIDRGFLFCNYETGIIYSTRSRNRIEQGMAIELKGSNCNGYRVHTIYFEGSKKQCRAHQIVWIAAHGLYDKDKFMIDHIDRDKMNNRLSNLRLVDAKENRENSTPYSGKLSPEEKNRLFALYSEGDMSMRELADDFGISKSRVQQLIKEHSGLDGITLDDWCEKSIAAAGNAIVPQVVYQIFQAIQKYESF